MTVFAGAGLAVSAASVAFPFAGSRLCPVSASCVKFVEAGSVSDRATPITFSGSCSSGCPVTECRATFRVSTPAGGCDRASDGVGGRAADPGEITAARCDFLIISPAVISRWTPSEILWISRIRSGCRKSFPGPPPWCIAAIRELSSQARWFAIAEAHAKKLHSQSAFLLSESMPPIQTGFPSSLELRRLPVPGRYPAEYELLRIQRCRRHSELKNLR